LIGRGLQAPAIPDVSDASKRQKEKQRINSIVDWFWSVGPSHTPRLKDSPIKRDLQNKSTLLLICAGLQAPAIPDASDASEDRKKNSESTLLLIVAAIAIEI
jgi:hypothetical protein